MADLNTDKAIILDRSNTGHKEPIKIIDLGDGTYGLCAATSKTQLGYDAWGKSKSVTDFSLYHGLFTFDVSYRMWVNTINDVEQDLATSTNAISENGMLKLSCTGTLNDVIKLVSKRHPRYQPNRGHLYSSSIIIPNKNATCIRDFGLLGHEDGVFFRLNNGSLYACIRNGDTITHEELITIPFDIDFEKGNIYDIQFQWRGVGNYKFFLGNPITGVSELVHEIKLLNELTTTSTQNASLPIGFSIENKGDVGTIYCGCVDVTSEGGNADILQYNSTTGNEITISDDCILAIRKPELYKSRVNTRDSILARVTVSSVKKGTVKVWLTRDSTALTITTGTWEDVNGGSTQAYKPTAAADSSFDSSKAGLVIARAVEAGKEVEITNPLPDQISFFITHGDYFIITGEASSGEMRATIEWGDEI